MQQMSLAVLSVLLVGAGKLASSLSLLRSLCSESSSNVLNYNMTLLKLMLSQGSHSLTAQSARTLLTQQQ